MCTFRPIFVMWHQLLLSIRSRLRSDASVTVNGSVASAPSRRKNYSLAILHAGM